MLDGGAVTLEVQVGLQGGGDQGHTVGEGGDGLCAGGDAHGVSEDPVEGRLRGEATPGTLEVGPGEGHGGV